MSVKHIRLSHIFAYARANYGVQISSVMSVKTVHPWCHASYPKSNSLSDILWQKYVLGWLLVWCMLQTLNAWHRDVMFWCIFDCVFQKENNALFSHLCNNAKGHARQNNITEWYVCIKIHVSLRGGHIWGDVTAEMGRLFWECTVWTLLLHIRNNMHHVLHYGKWTGSFAAFRISI